MVFQEQSDSSILDTRSDVQKSLFSVELSFVQRIKLRLFGNVYVGDRLEERWNSSIPCYAFMCKEHGLQIGYAVGYANLLLCPKCMH